MSPAPGVIAGTRPYFWTVAIGVIDEVDTAQAHVGASFSKIVEAHAFVAPASDGLFDAASTFGGGGTQRGAMAVAPARVKAVLRVMFMAIISKSERNVSNLAQFGL